MGINRKRLHIIMVVLLLLSSGLTISASWDKPFPTTTFTGSETFVGLVDPGTAKVADGKTITQGLVVIDLDTMSDPRVSGEATVTVNSVYSGDGLTGTGPLWGTIHISNANGGWNLEFSGKQSDGCQTIVHARGWGEGDYEGMRGVWEYQSSDCMLSASVSGTIVDQRK